MNLIKILFIVPVIMFMACKNQCDLQAKKKLPGDTTKIFLYGDIHDLNTKELMPNAIITIEGTRIGAMADPNGKYKLDITALTDTGKVYKFVCHYISYQATHVIIKSKLRNSTKLDIEMISSDGSNYVTYKMDRKTCTLKLNNRIVNEAPPKY